MINMVTMSQFEYVSKITFVFLFGLLLGIGMRYVKP